MSGELRGDTLEREECRVAYTIKRNNRYWEVRDAAGRLVCLTVYKCGAREVVHRLCPGWHPERPPHVSGERDSPSWNYPRVARGRQRQARRSR